MAVDDATIKRLEVTLKSQRQMLDSGLPGMDALFDFIVANEFSEWNDLFLYAVNVAKKDYAELIPAVVTTQQHKRFIERFIESHPGHEAHLKKLKGLATVWQEKILIVDDDSMVAEALSTIIEDEGLVKCASNGKKALEALESEYYAAIITDIDMPVMNGLDF